MENQVRRLKATISDAYHCQRLNLTLQEFNTKEQYTDLYFVCKGGILVKAHKLMICSVSPKLKQIFLELPEIFKIQEIHVSVPDIEARILRLVFDFLYEGQVKLDQSDSPAFHEVMTELGFPLAQQNSSAATSSQTQHPPNQTSTQLPPQMVYVQGPPSSQGQPQYIMAPAGSLNQGPLMTPMVQASIAQPSQQPMIMTQANGQLIQAQGQVLTNQVQQMQMVQQNNPQVMAMNNQMQVVQQSTNPVVSMSNQVVGANQLVQVSTQAVNQPLIMNNNQIQVGMQNQVVANSNFVVNQNVQQPQALVQPRVRANNVTTTNRQFNRNVQNQRNPQVPARNRPAVQPQTMPRVNNGAASSTRNLSTQDILSVLQQYGDLSTLTAEKILSSLEDKFGVDFSSQKHVIQQVLQEVQCPVNDNSGYSGLGVISSVVSGADAELPDDTSSQSKPKAKRPKQHRRKQSFLHPKSDDEEDEDFDPHQHAKKKSSKK